MSICLKCPKCQEFLSIELPKNKIGSLILSCPCKYIEEIPIKDYMQIVLQTKEQTSNEAPTPFNNIDNEQTESCNHIEENIKFYCKKCSKHLCNECMEEHFEHGGISLNKLIKKINEDELNRNYELGKKFICEDLFKLKNDYVEELKNYISLVECSYEKCKNINLTLLDIYKLFIERYKKYPNYHLISNFDNFKLNMNNQLEKLKCKLPKEIINYFENSQIFLTDSELNYNINEAYDKNSNNFPNLSNEAKFIKPNYMIKRIEKSNISLIKKIKNNLYYIKGDGYLRSCENYGGPNIATSQINPKDLIYAENEIVVSDNKNSIYFYDLFSTQSNSYNKKIMNPKNKLNGKSNIISFTIIPEKIIAVLYNDSIVFYDKSNNFEIIATILIVKASKILYSKKRGLLLSFSNDFIDFWELENYHKINTIKIGIKMDHIFKNSEDVVLIVDNKGSIYDINYEKSELRKIKDLGISIKYCNQFENDLYTVKSSDNKIFQINLVSFEMEQIEIDGTYVKSLANLNENEFYVITESNEIDLWRRNK